MEIVHGEDQEGAAHGAMAGQNAALSVYSHSFSLQPVRAFSVGIANILRAMEHSGTRRLACVTRGDKS